jgi:TonB-dependent receptor
LKGEKEMRNRILSILIITISLFINQVYAAVANVEGFVKDKETGDVLLGANVVLLNTSMGAATDNHGKYIIQNVPPGTYTLRASYIGYNSEDVTIDVTEGKTIEHNFGLQPVTVVGQTVTVTGQASGQLQSINKQLLSDQITNVVSSHRIQELPDANAAETLGRLPGIAVLRSGGEGNEIVIRGLAPQYNQILINGVKMASTDAFSRSEDLSMISSNSLEGIIVSKTVTPDMDANVLGGVVNFELREAKVDIPGVPRFDILAQGGYNNLENAYNQFNNYKYVLSGENRFFDNKFGTFIQFDYERKNLSSNEFGAEYTHKSSSATEYLINTLNLYNIPRDRQRMNGTIVMDYNLDKGAIKFSNFLSSGSTDIKNRTEGFDIQNNLHTYSFINNNNTLNIITNALKLQYELPVFNAEALLSHAYSETKTPNDWTITFQQGSAGLDQFINQSNLNPKDIPPAANNNLSATYLNNIITNSSFARERGLTGSLDLWTDWNITDLVSARIKFGGMYRHQTRSYDYEQATGQGLGLESAKFVDSLIASQFESTLPYVNTTNIPISPFIDPNYDYGKFLGGDYEMGVPLNFSMLSQTANMLRNNISLISTRDAIAYFHDSFNSTTNNYSGYEDQRAFYVMANVKIGETITVIPGVRYQGLKTNYTAAQGIQNTASATGGPYMHYDTTLSVDHSYWLPDVTLRYKPLSWFDVRLSYTNTLSYPDFNTIVPRIDVSTTGTILWNNYALNPSRSTNYDAYLSFYDNNIGLFTVGGFLKQIEDLIYPWTFYVNGNEALPYFPPGLAHGTPAGNYGISTYVNNSNRIDDYGLEVDWQTHFWYLPHPLEGLVLNINYTHIFSKASYPYTYIYKPSPRITVFVDTTYTDRLLYQPDNILNVALGYDFAGFSIRVSMLYQDDIFTGSSLWPQLRSSTSAYTRWDLAVKQELPWYGIQVFFDLNNINGARDVSVLQSANIPQSEQDYGMTADLGVRVKF